MSRPINRGVSIKRFNTLRFSFFFYSFFFLEGRKMNVYDNVPLRTRCRESRKVYFSIAFPPTLYLFTQRRVSFGHLPTRFQILIVSERMSSDVDPPRWLRCSVVSRMRRIPKGYSDTPGCIKFCNVINACLTSRIPVIRRIDKCLKFLFFLSLYVKSGHRTF